MANAAAVVGVVVINSIAFFLFCLTIYCYTVINNIYRVRLIRAGGQHFDVDEKQDPIQYGFGYNKPKGPPVGAFNLPENQCSPVARKTSTLEFPGLPISVDETDDDKSKEVFK